MKLRRKYLETDVVVAPPYIPGLLWDMIRFLVQMKLVKSGEGCSVWPNRKELNGYIESCFRWKKKKNF